MALIGFVVCLLYLQHHFLSQHKRRRRLRTVADVETGAPLVEGDQGELREGQHGIELGPVGKKNGAQESSGDHAPYPAQPGTSRGVDGMERLIQKTEDIVEEPGKPADDSTSTVSDVSLPLVWDEVSDKPLVKGAARDPKAMTLPGRSRSASPGILANMFKFKRAKKQRSTVRAKKRRITFLEPEIAKAHEEKLVAKRRQKRQAALSSADVISDESDSDITGANNKTPTSLAEFNCKKPSEGEKDEHGQVRFFLTVRSIWHDIQIGQERGRGRYATVREASYKGYPVAVKIFKKLAEPSWRRESEIYQTSLLRHKNLLGFIASDSCTEGPAPGFWIVTEYHKIGSLYDFLRERAISIVDLYRMVYSIANGLAHLHTEIPSSSASFGKPAIAHRDLKSKNILVKDDGTCCIADLGLACRYWSSSGEVDAPTAHRVGTRRYMAPEMLNKSLNFKDFDRVKACDIYSFGLVIWEIMRRTSHGPWNARLQAHYEANADPYGNVSQFFGPPELAAVVEPYMAPFEHSVSATPTTEEMYWTVCIKGIRPWVSTRWNYFAATHDMMRLMQECWYHDPMARLSAVAVRNAVKKLFEHHCCHNPELNRPDMTRPYLE